MLNKCSVYSCLIKSALEHAGTTLPLVYQQGKSTEVRLVHLSSYKQAQVLESVPDVTIINLHWPGFFQVIGPPTSP